MESAGQTGGLFSLTASRRMFWLGNDLPGPDAVMPTTGMGPIVEARSTGAG